MSVLLTDYLTNFRYSPRRKFSGGTTSKSPRNSGPVDRYQRYSGYQRVAVKASYVAPTKMGAHFDYLVREGMESTEEKPDFFDGPP